MWKKIAFGLVGVFVVVLLVLFLWARSILASDAVQVALARQISNAIGQPVTIRALHASIYPRIGVTLQDVGIGASSQIRVKTLDVGTDVRALLSRRIEHAALHLDGAHVELPLLPLTLGSASPTSAPTGSTSSPIEIVSIDEIMLTGIEIVSGGRTLHGDIELVPQGKGVVVKRVTLAADDMSLTATGTIADLAGPTGDLTVNAGALDVDRLVSFFNDFSAGLPPSAASTTTAVPPPAATPATPSARHLTIALNAQRATIGGLAIDRMNGHALIDNTAFAIEPLTFGFFGGTYNGGLTVTLGTTAPTFHWKAALAGFDVAAATAYAGSPNIVTGRLSGTIDLHGTGSDAATAMRTVAGTVRVDITNGLVRNLGIVRSVGAATSMNLAGLKQAAAGASANADEAFTRLGATMTVASGSASTQDLRFEATDLILLASGTVRLDGGAMDLKGQVQLSDALSRQMPATFQRATQENGRVVLPATITGPAAAPSVKVDAGDVAKRALRNTVNEQAPALLKKGLSGLMRK
jgi:uncharacterized protein involved in outer membrane biogenesis